MLYLSFLALLLVFTTSLQVEKKLRAADDTYYIMTRDDVALKTYFWYPDEKTFPKPWSTVYEKTPYNAGTEGGEARTFNNQGFAYMSQDMRGMHGSNGTYSFFRTSGNDSIDTVTWFNANTQDWSNGQLSFHGVSADCLGQYASLTGVTQSGYWPDGNYEPYLNLFDQILTGICALGNGVGHQTVFQGGAYRQGLINRWLAAIGQESMTAQIKQNENWNPWWYTLDGQAFEQWNILDQPLLNFAGFYDIFGQNQIYTVQQVNITSKSIGQQILFVDPGGHCPSGDIFWPNGESGWDYVNNVVGPMVFDAIFKAKTNGESFDIHSVLDFNVMFYMLGPGGVGESGNFWVQGLSFPPIISTDQYYFTGDCTGNICGLNQTAYPTESSVTYTFDPDDPVDTWGGNNLMVQPCGPWDQNRIEEGRTDVMYFQTQNFNSDWGFVGNLTVNLWVSSDSPDTDFVAKVTDVYPNGDSYLIQDSIIRMRWRDGYYAEEQSPDMVQGQIYNVQIDLGYMSWYWNKGHAMKVTITSSNNPRFSLNYNTGNWVDKGSVGGHPAVNTIHFGGQYDSYLEVNTVDLDWVNSHKFDFDNIDKTNWWDKETSRRSRGKMFASNEQFMEEYLKEWDRVDEMAEDYQETHTF